MEKIVYFLFLNFNNSIETNAKNSIYRSKVCMCGHTNTCALYSF